MIYPPLTWNLGPEEHIPLQVTSQLGSVLVKGRGEKLGHLCDTGGHRAHQPAQHAARPDPECEPNSAQDSGFASGPCEGDQQRKATIHLWPLPTARLETMGGVCGLKM